MKPTRDWNQHTRFLLLEFAVILPALALITFSIVHLKSLGHDKTVEAAMDRDLQNMLLLTDKQMTSKAFEIAETIRDEFPGPGPDAPKALHRILEEHPYAAHVFLYDQKSGAIFASQPARMADPDFRQEREKLASSISTWLPMEGKDILEKLTNMDKQDGRPFMFDYSWVPRGNRKLYQATILFSIKNESADRVAIGAISFDAEYLKDSFFPGALNFMADCPTNRASDTKERPALMLHAKRESNHSRPRQIGTVGSQRWNTRWNPDSPASS